MLQYVSNAMRDTTLFLIDSSGDVIDHNDDTGDTLYSKLSFQAQEGETYSVRVGAYDNDEFTEGNHILANWILD